MEYKVVKEFPGLKVGDILREEEGTGFYVNKKEDVDVSETVESVYINSIALSKDIVESERAYFAPIAPKKEEPIAIVDPIITAINEMSQVLAMTQADKVTALNDYHAALLDEMIEKIENDIKLLTKYSK